MMRTDKEVLKTILEYSEKNDSIRAVYMNGSRANPNVEKDIFMDFDIVFVVDEIETFKKNLGWLNNFGEIAMIQDPNANDEAFDLSIPDTSQRYNWLILFKDNNRLDLTIMTVEYAVQEVANDSLTVILLDKNGIFPRVEESSDKDYHVKRPSEEQFTACVNNFWWCLQNVAKGLARKHIPYALNMYNLVVREMLDRMVNWHIGCQNDFAVSVGMWGKYYRKLLSPSLYRMYEKTYSDCEVDNIWESINNACELFNTVSATVAESLGYSYNLREEAAIREYISFVKKNHESS